VPGIEKFQHRTIATDEIDEKTNRLLKHRLAERIGELGKTISIDAIVLFKAAKIEPIAGEFECQGLRPRRSEHPLGLGEQDVRLPELTRLGDPQQFIVRHAGPQKVAQATRQLDVG